MSVSYFEKCVSLLCTKYNLNKDDSYEVTTNLVNLFEILYQVGERQRSEDQVHILKNNNLLKTI